MDADVMERLAERGLVSGADVVVARATAAARRRRRRARLGVGVVGALALVSGLVVATRLRDEPDGQVITAQPDPSTTTAPPASTTTALTPPAALPEVAGEEEIWWPTELPGGLSPVLGYGSLGNGTGGGVMQIRSYVECRSCGRPTGAVAVFPSLSLDRPETIDLVPTPSSDVQVWTLVSADLYVAQADGSQVTAVGWPSRLVEDAARAAEAGIEPPGAELVYEGPSYHGFNARWTTPGTWFYFRLQGGDVYVTQSEVPLEALRFAYPDAIDSPTPEGDGFSVRRDGYEVDVFEVGDGHLGAVVNWPTGRDRAADMAAVAAGLRPVSREEAAERFNQMPWSAAVRYNPDNQALLPNGEPDCSGLLAGAMTELLAAVTQDDGHRLCVILERDDPGSNVGHLMTYIDGQSDGSSSVYEWRENTAAGGVVTDLDPFGLGPSERVPFTTLYSGVTEPGVTEVTLVDCAGAEYRVPVYPDLNGDFGVFAAFLPSTTPGRVHRDVGLTGEDAREFHEGYCSIAAG